MRVLETERLVLRQFRQDDLKHVVSWQSESGAATPEGEAQDFLNFCFREYLKWGIGPWALVLRQTEAVVGSCSFCHIDSDRASGEVNYYVTPPYRRQGLAAEALGAILEFGFEDIGLARIQARCALSNAGSERVAQKAGMTFERLLAADAASPAGSGGYRLYTIGRGEFKPRSSK